MAGGWHLIRCRCLPRALQAQVKGEQDLALKYLSSQRRPFRAAALPLSTAEPRFAELAQRAQQRRAEAHEQRLELLRRGGGIGCETVRHAGAR